MSIQIVKRERKLQWLWRFTAAFYRNIARKFLEWLKKKCKKKMANVIYTFGKMRNNIINEKTARWSGMRNAADCGVGVHRRYEVIVFFSLSLSLWLVLRNQSQVAWHIVLLCRRKHQPKKNFICWFSLISVSFLSVATRNESIECDAMDLLLAFSNFAAVDTIVFMGNRHTHGNSIHNRDWLTLSDSNRSRKREWNTTNGTNCAHVCVRRACDAHRLKSRI